MLTLYVAAATYFLIMDRVFCPFEERKSALESGERYARYRENVRRWL
jgi:protein-S-isoprenylcysteine O-methyltransferase Ste14